MSLNLICDTGAGLVYDGQDNDRGELLAAARQWLIDQGVHRIDAEDATIDRRGLIVRGWWGDVERGLVQEHHDDAQPVTVVHVYDPAVVAEMDARTAAADAERFAADEAARASAKSAGVDETPALTRFPEAS